MAHSETTLRNNEPAFVLHTYPYRETSLIVEALSRHAGRVAHADQASFGSTRITNTATFARLTRTMIQLGVNIDHIATIRRERAKMRRIERGGNDPRY